MANKNGEVFSVKTSPLQPVFTNPQHFEHQSIITEMGEIVFQLGRAIVLRHCEVSKKSLFWEYRTARVEYFLHLFLIG